MKNFIKSVLILIAVLMSTTGSVEVIYAQVGDTVTLKPPGGENLQKHYLYWFFGEGENLQLAWSNPLGGQGFIDNSDEKAESWNQRLSLSEYSLIIKNIQQQHFGTFSCKLKDRDTTTKYALRKLSVTVNPPSPLLSSEPLSLFCDAESPPGQKKPEIHWLSPKGEKIKSKEGKVTVTATGEHSGQWTCVLRYDEKEQRVPKHVPVVDLSPAPLHPQYTSKSSPLTVPCSIAAQISWKEIKAKGIRGVYWNFFPMLDSSLISNYPQRLFSLSLDDPLKWKPADDRGLTPVKDLTKGNLSLTRNRGREEDAGDYVCSLNFTNGVTLNRTVHVYVLKIISSPGTDLISGQQVSLNCSLCHPMPSDLQVKWVPPGPLSLPSLSSDHQRAILPIMEVGTGDSGKWRCELWKNSTRLTSAVTILKIEPKLSVWMLVIICSVTVIVILLLVLVFIFYRRKQRKMRHLRHRLCQCKNPKPKGFYRT